MDSYIDLLRNIVKNFNNEFDDVIKRILNKLFNNYYVNREKYIYCIDNLFKKYDVSKHNFIKKKYGIVKKQDLIFRFNRCNKKYYIIKLLKSNFHIILDENETYESVAAMILQKNGIKNCKKYIDDVYIEKYLNSKKVGDFQIKIIKRTCHFPPCLNQIIGSNNYCNLHDKDMI